MNHRVIEKELNVLRARVRELQGAFDYVGAYVFTKDTNGRYTFANQMVCDLFDCDLAGIIGKTDEAFFDLKASGQLRKHDLHVLTTGERIEGEEVNVIAATGDMRIYWSVKVPMRDESGNITGLCGISTDITKRRRLEKQLAQQKTMMESIMENVEACIYMKDNDCRYLYANAKTLDIFGARLEEVVGRTDAEIMPPAMIDGCQLSDQRMRELKGKISSEEIFPDRHGNLRHFWSTKIPLYREGAIESFIGISTDITEIVQLREQFKFLANTDSLTGLYNRRHWMEQAEREFTRVGRYGGSMAVMLCDIDGFKSINDQFGHDAGDRTLVAVARSCKSELRDGDIVGRLGGDEIVALLCNASAEGALAAAERVRTGISATVLRTEDGIPIKVTSSIGLAVYGPHATLTDLLRAADNCLYQAKAHGRNRTHVDGISNEAVPAMS